MKSTRVFVRTFSVLSLFAFCLAATLHPAAAQDRTYRYDTIALSGEPLPGTGDTVVNSPFGIGLNNAGELIVVADQFFDPSRGFANGLWLWRQGVLTPIAVYGAPIPGIAGEVFDGISGNSPRINSIGSTAFITSDSSSNSVFDQRLYSSTQAGMDVIARTGDPAPGAGGLLFNFLDFGPNATAASGAAAGATTAAVPNPERLFLGLSGPLLNGGNDIVFLAELADCFDCSVATVYEDSLWLNSASGLQLLALTGDLAPGAAGSEFSAFLHYSMNDAGRIAFRALLNDRTGANQGLWTGTAGALNLIAKTGDEAPGTNGLSFTEFASEGEFGPALSASGDYFFRAFVSSGDQANDVGLWLFRNGFVEPVARAGDPAPGAGGAVFQSVDEPQIASTGGIAFRGSLPAVFPNNDEGIWLGTAEAPELAVRSGDLAPGTSGNTFNSFGGFGVNASGELAFGAGLGSAMYTQGVFTKDGTDVFPVLVPGQSIEVRPGDFRTVANTYFFGNFNQEGGLVTSFNDQGQIMFSVEFEDRTQGVLLATPVDPLADQPPMADAGPDQTVSSADSVVLDGRGSFDPEGGPLTYRWRLDGTEIATGPTPTVGPFAVGSYRIILTVTDQAGLQWSDAMSLTVLPPNMPPLADAGPDQTVGGNQSVTLDGLGSSDPEGETLTYSWTLDGATVGTSATVTVGPLSVGTHIATLTVTDPQGASASDSVTITVVNGTPIAQAGPDVTINHATIVNLDGSGSQDPDGDSLDFLWSLDGVEIGTGATASVGPFEPGTYTIVMTVTDPLGASATDSLVVTVVNDPPVANAGSDQTVASSSAVLLDGSGSSDPEGESLTFAWSLGGQQIASGPTPTIGPFGPGVYTIALIVTDSRGASATDSLVLTVTNTAPLADAGPDLSVQGPVIVTLDGSGSSDPDGDALTYSWSLDGVEIATGPQPNVGPFAEGSYVFTLTVTDPAGAASSDSVTLTVLNAPPVADAGPDQTIVTSRSRKRVTLDGSASSDADGTIVSYVWRLDGSVLGSGVSIRPRLRRGTNTVVLTVTDDDGASSSDEVVVIITRGTQVSGDD